MTLILTYSESHGGHWSSRSIKSRRIKQNSQECFDGEFVEKISIGDKLFKKFKKSKLQIYKIARYEVQKLIS